MKTDSRMLVLNMKYISLSLLFLCAMLSGVIPQTVVAILFTLLLVSLLFTDCFYLAFPIVLFYYSSLGLLFGISVYRIFSLLFITKAILLNLYNDKYGYTARNHILIKNNSAFLLLVSIVYLLY